MKNLAYIRNILRYGSRYCLRDNPLILYRKARRLDENVKYSTASQSVLSATMLLRTLKCAVKTIPYYRQFDSIVARAKIRDVYHILPQFPVVSKTDILQNRNAFYPNGGKKRIWWARGKTSGTTGTPLEIFRSYNSVLYENAFIRRHWQWSGFGNRCRRATLRGDLVVPVKQSKPPFWFYNIFDNQLLISSRHLLEKCLPKIIDRLERFSPYILEAYPSTAYELAKYLERQDIKINIPFTYTGSEILYAHQRELIEQRFNTCVMDFYGMAERVAFAGECRQGKMHLNSDYSFVELIDINNQPTDTCGYIAGTTFHNLAMPLIRYKLSDLVKLSDEHCTCGCPFPVIESIQGKYEDILYGGDGNPISPSVLTFAFKGLNYIKRSQVSQVEEKKWEVRVVPDASYSDNESNKLVENIKMLVDPTVSVSIKLVDEIPRTQAGKYRWVVNEWLHKPEKGN